MKKMLTTLVGICRANYKLLLGIAIGAALSLSIAAYAVHKSNTQTALNKESQQEEAVKATERKEMSSETAKNTSSNPNPSPQNSTKPNNTGTSSGNSSTPPTTTSVPSVPPVSTPPAPTTLAGCTYTTGPPAGRACPASPPSSFSYSASWPCMYNGGYVPCQPYSSTVQIEGYTYNNNAYCRFYFTPLGSKSIRVLNISGGSEVDCSTAQAL